jgi:hypothetical protein
MKLKVGYASGWVLHVVCPAPDTRRVIDCLFTLPISTYIPVSLSFLLCFFPINRRKQPSEKKKKAVSKDDKKAYKGIGVTTPHILNLCTGCK